MSPISFGSISNSLRIPFWTAEFDNTQANQSLAALPYRGLLIGQKTSAGSASANSLHQVTSADEVATLAGRGSVLHAQAKGWFKVNKETELWILVLEDNGAGVAAAWTFTVTGTATEDGTLSIYVGGELVEVAITSGDGQNTIAAAIEAALDLAEDLIFTSGVATNVVTSTCRHAGSFANDLDIRLNYNGEETPAGVAVAIAQSVTGTTSPTLTTGIAALLDNWYHIWAHPYTDATSLTAIENELSDRFGPMRMIDGVAFTAKDDSFANLATLGNTRNSPHSVIMGNKDNPTPPWVNSAKAAGLVAKYGSIDPARPFHTLPLTDSLPPAESERLSNEQRNLLLYDGIATTVEGPGGVMQLEGVITTYKENAAGSPDESYLYVNTMLTLMYARYSFRTRMATKYPRHKLADDGTRFGPGQAVITPAKGRAEALAWFRELEEAGLVENFEEFKENLVVERNASNRNRLDFLLPPNLINQLVVGAANFQFR
jgi:phage tail sheath gpL-like